MAFQTTDNLVQDFNQIVNVGIHKEWKEFNPQFSELLYKFNSGMTKFVDFPFWGYIGGMQEFKGSRKHRKPEIASTYRLENIEYDNAVDITEKDFERASFSENPIGALQIYQDQITGMARDAKENPVQLAFELLEAGETDTFGKAFDDQNFFSTNHTYLTDTLAQSNLLTGSGTSLSQLQDDLINKALQGLNSFRTQQSEGRARVKFNKMIQGLSNDILILAPDSLFGKFHDLQKSSIISNTTNTASNFRFSTLPLSDSNDWYAVLLDDPIKRPFLNPIEKPMTLDLPKADDHSVKENGFLTWGARQREAVGYGLWWKAIKVTNA